MATVDGGDTSAMGAVVSYKGVVAAYCGMAAVDTGAVCADMMCGDLLFEHCYNLQ